MVKFQSEAERMSTRAAAAAGSGGERGRRRRARAGIGGGGARLARAVGETKIFFSVSSNPGRGGKKFFFEKSMEIFFSGRSE